MIKIIFKVIVGVFVLLLVIVLTSDILVRCNAKGRLYDSAEEIPECQVGLLLGTTPQTRIGGRKNAFFKYRIEAATELYKAGKIREILVSGDKHSLEGINEPVAMRDSLVVRGIPFENIHLDGDGYRTICSVINAKTVFGYDSFTIISQQFHNERALYQAEHLDLGLGKIYGYNAKSPHSTLSILTYLREYLARIKMFLDLGHGNTYIEQAEKNKVV